MTEPAPPGARTRGGFPEDVAAYLARVEPGHYWFENRSALIVWALGRYFPEARTLLEAGCGTGFVLQSIRRAFPHIRLTGSDAMTQGLDIARARVPDADILQQDARALGASGPFDVVCAFDVLEHIEDDAAALAGLHAATAPGGGLLITVPQHPWLWSRADDFGHHVRRYRRKELRARIEQAGFDIVRLTSFVTLLLPLLAASRWMERGASGELTQREAVPHAAVNAALTGVLALERKAIQAGVTWPAGGSLLAVAQKRAR